MLTHFVDGADVGMVERGGGLGLALEPLQRLPVPGEMLGQELQGDEAREAGVLGLVDHSHPAAPDAFEDAVVRDCPAH